MDGNVRYDLDSVPDDIREELLLRIVRAARDDTASTTVLLFNRSSFEEMFSQQGVRVMVSDLVPAGTAGIVLDLAEIRTQVATALRAPIPMGEL